MRPLACHSPVTMLAGTALLLCSTLPVVAAAQGLTFSKSELFFELNNTDGDLGIHSLIDGGPWKRLEIEDPQERKILDVILTGRLRRQGLTELFFESAEPTFDELAPAEFFRRFPEGRYEIGGIAMDGEEIESVAMISHVIPAPAGNILVAGLPVPEDCDAGPIPAVNAGETLLITWDAVTGSHPDLGRNGAVTIAQYEVFVEREGLKLSVQLPPEITSLEVPASFLALGEEFKLEILARATTGNRTAVETCFNVE